MIHVMPKASLSAVESGFAYSGCKMKKSHNIARISDCVTPVSTPCFKFVFALGAITEI
jgi:hypothetical protein